MGRQFQVYLLPTDTTRLVETLDKRIGVRLLSTRSAEAEPVEVESAVETEAGASRVACLLVPDLLVSIKMDHFERQNYWTINTLVSEVVEFSGCHFDGTTLKRGRFFYDPGLYKAGTWQEKSPRFLEWADALFKVAKKSLKRVASLDAYVGRDAELWRAKGGTFVALAVKGQPPVIAK